MSHTIDHPKTRILPCDIPLESQTNSDYTVLGTDGVCAQLFLHRPLPATSVVGRQADRMVPHPALDGKGHVVEQTYDYDFESGSVIAFGAGRLIYIMPWAALASLVIRRRIRVLHSRGFQGAPA